VDKDDKVVSIAKCPKEDDDELDIESADMMDGIDLNDYNLDLPNNDKGNEE
jgi:DNA gyrase subunit A